MRRNVTLLLILSLATLLIGCSINVSKHEAPLTKEEALELVNRAYGKARFLLLHAEMENINHEKHIITDDRVNTMDKVMDFSKTHIPLKLQKAYSKD